MDEIKIDQYIISNSRFFPASKIAYIKEKLSVLTDEKSALLYSIELKDPITMLIISIFLGHFGVDRFMLSDIGLGILKLITFGGCGVWTIIDWCLISNITKEYNYNELMKII